MKHNLLWLVSLGLACSLAACGGDDEETTQEPKEPDKPQVVENTMVLCSDGIDNDDNGKADCDDEGCGGFVFCKSDDSTKENTPKTCSDGEDNDGDGDIDCADAQCKSFTLCKASEPENTDAACKDGLDNDKDGKKDCDDSDCASFCTSDPGPGPEPAKVENTDALCHDSQDNDGDGKVDCDDSDCSPFCTSDPGPGPQDKVENTPALCQDGQDNDGDGQADCLDTDCQGFDVCNTSEGVKENTRELCTDGKDNDGNGAADCDDKNCKTLLVCTSGGKSGENSPALCANGMDDDGDSLSDCADPECHYFELCQGKTVTGENSEAACNDGIDNDKDGYVDCADAECQGFASCSDACPDDPFKFVDDQCGCGKTLIDGECYTNITEAVDFQKLKDSSEKFIIKRPINLGTTDMAPITGFKGVLFGDDMRITGYLTQTAVTSDKSDGYQECGLFGATDGTPVFKNINIAITLNCEDNKYSGKIKAGALVSASKGSLTDIEGESKVMLISKNSEMDTKAYDVYVGGIGGSLSGDIQNVEVTGNTSAEIEWTFTKAQESGKLSSIYIGGVAGNASGGKVSNIQAPSNVTLDYKLSFGNNKWDNTIYVGGIAGYAIRLDKCSNIGGNILVQHGNDNNTNYSHYIGGIVGNTHRVTNSVFEGKLTSNGSAGNQEASDKYDSTLIGGITGALRKFESSDDTVVDGCYSHASMTLISGAGMYVGGLVGRMGSKPEKDKTDSEKYYILNSYSDTNLSVMAPKTSYDKMNFYWGGAVAQAAEYGYVLNSHLRSNYMFDEFSVSSDDKSTLSLGGIVAKTDTNKDENGGQLIDNIVSGGPKVSEGSENAGKFSGSMAATFGYYIYETYWDGSVYGTKTQEATQSTKQDVTAMPYSYNASGVPVLSDSRTVLGLLRSNSGHDESPMSAKLPPKLIYSDWKEITDSDNHKIPVPVSSWY